MPHAILMPKAGQSMTEGKIVAWLKKEGDPVERGDPILEIETDKANLEVEAEAAGVLRKIIHREGEMCPVLSVIGVIGRADEEIDLEALRRAAATEEARPAPGAFPPGRASAVEPAAGGAASSVEVRAEPSPAARSPPPPPPEGGRSSNGGRVAASPLARRVARERGVDLARLSGTGPGGRILRRDVEEAPAVRSVRAAPGPGALFPEPKAEPYPPPSPRPEPVVPFSGMRKAIAAALQQSKQVSPHFYATVSIDAGAALHLKQKREAVGEKVTFNDIIVRASAIALADEPRMNCRVHPDRIEYPAAVNVGIAVGTDDGLVVPVIIAAQEKDLAATARESRRIIEAALAGKLIGSGQGTFTLSNLGMFGVESFTAIINPPEGAILAVGAVRTELVPIGGGFFPRPIFKVTLSSDHRAIDGIIAARFLKRLRHLIEDPSRL